MHAPQPFERIDQAVNAGDRKRIAANQQALQAHGDAQLGMLEVRGHHGVEAAPAAHAQDGRSRTQQVAYGVKGFGAQRDKAELVAVIRLFHEALVAGSVRGADPAHFGAHAVGVTAVVKVVAVGKANAVERVELFEGDVVSQTPAGQRPQLFKQRWHGDDGRARVKSVAALAVDISAAARRVQFLQHRDAPAAR